MQSRLAADRNAGRKRCRLAQPPLTASGHGAEGAEILAEVPGPSGVLLWGGLRDVTLWALAARSSRAQLFAPGASELRTSHIKAHLQLEDEVLIPLLTLAVMTERAAGVDANRLTFACRRLAAWADVQGRPDTRLAFTQAAALTRPNDCRLALETAKLARDSGQSARAETWFRRAIKLARSNHWETYVWAYIGLAVLYRRAGNLPAAMAVARRAHRTAIRRRLRGLDGVALHHMFVFASDGPDPTKAYEFASAALQAYGAEHPRVIALAHDVACFWADQGQFARALPVLSAAASAISAPQERAVAMANLARAAAGCGARDAYEGARTASEQIMAGVPGEAGKSDAHLNLGRAGVLAGETSRAVEALSRAAAIAARRGEAQVRLVAECELQALMSEQAASGPPSGEPARAAREADRLAGILTATVSNR
jgi:tetratricopeptide (TPR) repeat protein